MVSYDMRNYITVNYILGTVSYDYVKKKGRGSSYSSGFLNYLCLLTLAKGSELLCRHSGS